MCAGSASNRGCHAAVTVKPQGTNGSAKVSSSPVNSSGSRDGNAATQFVVSPRVPLSLCHDVVIVVEPLDGHSMRHATFIADQQVELAPLQLNSNQVWVRGS